jgi:glycosyltransferase involved in cell wall biosynthesis
MPRISVIIPVYKAENYLAECIDSVLAQTFSDFELILVDDGSPDNCAAICRDYITKDSRIRFLQQENQGQAAARNHAMTIAEGAWICFVDSDDLIHPRMLELLYQAVAESRAPVSMCCMLEAVDLPENFFGEREVSFEVLTMDETSVIEDGLQNPATRVRTPCIEFPREVLQTKYPIDVLLKAWQSLPGNRSFKR